MPIPLILQIQQAALDSKSSLSDALRMAKVATAKLGLTEFEKWVDLELDGYIGIDIDEIPKYRKIRGRPEGYNPYHGWQSIMFESAAHEKMFSTAPINMSIFAVEESLKGASSPNGLFEFPFPPEVASTIRKAINDNCELRIRLDVPSVAAIVDGARNILLNWTIDLEAKGILGENLMFSQDEKDKSVKVTESVVNNFHIGQVASLVQTATNSVVKGEINTDQTLANGVRDLIQQIGQWLPSANLPAAVEEDTRQILTELHEAESAAKPDRGRLKRGLEALQRVVAPAGEHLMKLAVDAAFSKLLDPPPT